MHGYPVAQALQQSAQQGGVALPDLPQLPGLPRGKQFIPADQKTDPGFGEDPAVLDAAAGQAGHLRHAQTQAGLNKDATSGGLLIRGANPGIGTAGLD